MSQHNPAGVAAAAAPRSFPGTLSAAGEGGAKAMTAARASCCRDEDAELFSRVRLGLSDSTAETYYHDAE